MPSSVTHLLSALFPFGGLGSGALGFAQSQIRLGADTARIVSVGGIDNDPLACADFEYLTKSPALCADIATLSPADLREFAHANAVKAGLKDFRRPDIVFSSPPCKGFSKLLSKDVAKTIKYQELNELVLKGLFLVAETWRDDLPPALLLENVGNIVARGAELLRQVRSLLTSYGYVFTESIHDCGEVGGLAQHRRRFLLVARRPDAVPSFIYRPPRLRVRGCGEVLETLPMPEDEDAGPLHALPNISPRNALRLALIPAGGDWRDLPTSIDLSGLEAGADPAAAIRLGRTSSNAKRFKGRPGYMEVLAWDQPSRAVNGSATVSGSTGSTAVADPRLPPELRNPVPPGRSRRSVFSRWDVRGWDQPARTIAGPGMNGGFAVADPRIPTLAANDPASASLPDAARVEGALALAPNAGRHEAKYRVTAWDDPVGTVTGARPVTSGGPSVADPRIRCSPRAGTYGVLSWQQAAATITGNARIDNGMFAVADPRPPVRARITVIIAPDGTWHRPLTTLELAALQGIPVRVDGAPLRLASMTDIGRKRQRATSSWRERIGNAVPRQAAQALGEAIGTAILASRLGRWVLGGSGIWVRDDGLDEETVNAPWLEEDLAAAESRFQAACW